MNSFTCRISVSRQEQYPEGDFEVFHGYLRVGNDFEPAQSLRERYVDLTRRLIHQICGGSDCEQRYDVVVYLDKSARPLKWMVDAFWDEFAFEDSFFELDDSENNTPDQLQQLRREYKPDTVFLNIDKGQWIKPENIEYDSGTRIDRWNGIHTADDVALTSLRAVLSERINHEIERGQIDAASVLNTPTVLDGKRVLIVDEVKSTGATLSLARSLISKAVGDNRYGQSSSLAEKHGVEFAGAAAIDTYTWMSSGITRMTGASRNTETPVWYRDDTGEKHEGHNKGIGGRVPKFLGGQGVGSVGALWLQRGMRTVIRRRFFVMMLSA